MTVVRRAAPLLLAVAAGCGGGIPSEASRAAVAGAMERGRQAAQSADHAGAADALKEALAGPVSADDRVDALRLRAASLAELGQLDEALAAAEEALQGLDDADGYLVRARVHLKRGDKGASKADVAAARERHPKLLVPKELR